MPSTRRSTPSDARSSSRTLTLAFFFSGAAALIFEIVWVHRFGLVFGESVGATSIVLSSFMGGMALGTALAGLAGRRLGSLLRAYAALELTVAITGLGLTYLLPTLPKLTAPIAAGAGAHLWIINLTRFAASFVALLLPTTAMGATLPVVVGSRSSGQRSFGQALGDLYGWNTLRRRVRSAGRRTRAREPCRHRGQRVGCLAALGGCRVIRVQPDDSATRACIGGQRRRVPDRATGIATGPSGRDGAPPDGLDLRRPGGRSAPRARSGLVPLSLDVRAHYHPDDERPAGGRAGGDWPGRPGGVALGGRRRAVRVDRLSGGMFDRSCRTSRFNG